MSSKFPFSFPPFGASATAVLGFGLAMGLTGQSVCAIDFLKRDTQRLSETQMADAEGAAGAMLAEAQSREAANQHGKALDIYQSVVKKYPRSSAAAESQFKVGEFLQIDGKDKRAFEEFQKFLTDYKGSPRYGEAVQRQFAIAENLRANGSKGFLGGIGADIQPSKLIEFYEQITSNAPRTETAAQSRIAVGNIHAKQGDIAEAIVAFESVVDEYPGSKYASEAQFNLFKLHGQEASKSFSPVDLRQQREAGEDFINQFGSDPRTGDVRSALGQLSEKELEKAYEVGRFYEKSGDNKAAVIYYRQVARNGNHRRSADAQQRISALVAKDPSLGAIANARPAPRTETPETAPTIAAAPPVALPQVPPGKPAPAAPGVPAEGEKKSVLPFGLFKGDKPKLRASGDDVLPIPTDDPVATAPAPVAPGN
jgi:outer membrane protein assembly factor BamD (BamD/ComL family)